MNLITIVVFTAFFGQQLVSCKQPCRVSSLRDTFPDGNYLIHGIRDDKSALLLPSTFIKDDTISEEMRNSLDGNVAAKAGLKNFNTMLVEVQGLLQFLTIWQEKRGERHFYTLTRIAYFEAFRLVFDPTPDQILYRAKYTTLFYFSDLPALYFDFITTAGSAIYLHQQGYDIAGSYQLTLGRKGTKLFVRSLVKYGAIWNPPFLNLFSRASGDDKLYKWMVRGQSDEELMYSCVITTKNKFGLHVLHGRKHLLNAYHQMGNSILDCKEMNCKSQILANDGRKYHDQEVDPIYKKGSIFLGFRNGYIFSYQVVDDKEKFSEILFLLDLAHYPVELIKPPDDDYDVHLFSLDGTQVIVVICGSKSYYRIYNIDPRNGHKVIYLNKAEMTVIADLEKKCFQADYDAINAKLIFFTEYSQVYELPLTLNHDGVLKRHHDPKLVMYDNFRGVKKSYEGTSSNWPFQLHNGRRLDYNETSKAIEMTYEYVDTTGKSLSRTETVTKFGNYVESLLYFPIEYIEDEYMERLRSKSSKFPISFYGILYCTVFVLAKFEDLDSVRFADMGCDQSYNMRVILTDSYITVLRTKDYILVEAARIKVSFDYNDVINGIKGSRAVVFTHDLVNSEFRENYVFEIEPGSFDVIYNIGEYTYSERYPRDDCSYYFRKHKINNVTEEFENVFEFPILSVSYREFMQSPCDFELNQAIYDESVHGVFYVMTRAGETILATPNALITDFLEFVKNKEFLGKHIHSISFPYILYSDYSGAVILNMQDPSTKKMTFNTTFSSVGIYAGKILYRESEAVNILPPQKEEIEKPGNAVDEETKFAAKRSFEEDAFGIANEGIGRSELDSRNVNLTMRKYMI